MKLITPPENSKGARDITGLSISEVLKIVAEANGLAFNDSQPGKIYIGRKNQPVKVPRSGGVHYPLANTYAERHPDNNADKYAPSGPASPLIKGPDDFKLSPNFSLGEFRPKSGAYDGVRVHPDLVAALEKIRSKAGGKAIRITSAYRPPEYNRAVGGVPNSAHVDGLAADIYCDGLSTGALWDIANEVIGDGGGVGYYPSSQFVHIDVRGYRSRWEG
jgi:hypothetical protein